MSEEAAEGSQLGATVLTPAGGQGLVNTVNRLWEQGLGTRSNSLEENAGLVMEPHVVHQLLHVGEGAAAARRGALQHFPCAESGG